MTSTGAILAPIKDRKEKAVIFDNASVASIENGDTDWIEEACMKLSHSNNDENEGEESENEEYI
jgi:hypothetical protein